MWSRVGSEEEENEWAGEEGEGGGAERQKKREIPRDPQI